MKRFIPLFIGAVICYSISAQDGVDALRFSETFSGGTARSTAMGGAFGALGADFYSTSQNPAGLGFYRSSELVFTPELYYSKTKSNYLGYKNEDFKYNFNFNNFGYVSTYNSGKDKGLVGASFAFGFNRINNFHSYTAIEGTNGESSLADHYQQTANYYSSLDPFTDGLFYDAYILNFDTTLNSYVVDSRMYLPGVQRKTIDRSGKINEWNFSAGFNYSNLLYFGGSFSILPLYYEETSNYSEMNAADLNSQYFNLYENSVTRGTGFAGKFGVIVTPVPILHLGIAFHTPVSYRLNYKSETNIVSQFVPGGGIVYPYQYEDGTSNDYTLITPYKAIGSLGLVFGKIGVLSADLEYIDYASMRLRRGTGGNDFFDVNQEIKYIYRDNINIKTGAEVRLGTLYLRGGFGYYGSPYRSSEINKDAYHLGYSAGLGIREKHFFIDFAWNYMVQKEKYILYDWTDYSTNPSTDVFYTSDQTKNNMKIMTTIGFRF